MFGALSGAEPLYYLLFVVLIVFFGFFYVSIIFNPNEAADNMRKYGGFIPGIRPGKNTAEYIDKILSKITLVGGLISISAGSDSSDHDLGNQAANVAPCREFIDAHFPRWLLDGLVCGSISAAHPF